MAAVSVFRYGVLFRSAFGKSAYGLAEIETNHLRQCDEFVQTIHDV